MSLPKLWRLQRISIHYWMVCFCNEVWFAIETVSPATEQFLRTSFANSHISFSGAVFTNQFREPVIANQFSHTSFANQLSRISFHILVSLTSYRKLIFADQLSQISFREPVIADLWPLMSQLVRLGLDHHQDRNNPQVEQVGGLHISFSYDA